MIDSHSHLTAPIILDEIDFILKECKKNNVNKIITSSTQQKDFALAQEIAEKNSEIYFTKGLHPWYLKNLKKSDKEIILAEISNIHQQQVAIGEIGLDAKYEIAPQMEIFLDQLAIAQENNLPVIIHCYKCWPDLQQALKKIKKIEIPLVFHGFLQNKELAKQLLHYNSYFSVNGQIFTKTPKKVLPLLNEIYPNHLLFETDTPNMFPRFLQEKTGQQINYPQNVFYIGQQVAQLLQKNFLEVEKVTDKIASEVFKFANR